MKTVYGQYGVFGKFGRKNQLWRNQSFFFSLKQPDLCWPFFISFYDMGIISSTFISYQPKRWHKNANGLNEIEGAVHLGSK